jgi:DnaK suppressor protein
MTKTEVDRFSAALTARVAELKRVARHRVAITVERSADQVEQIQSASQRALAVCNLDREFHQLRDAGAALSRIQGGSFGTCHECDEDIHSKPLAVMPWATFCIRSQESADGALEEMRTPTRDLLRAA